MFCLRELPEAQEKKWMERPTKPKPKQCFDLRVSTPVDCFTAAVSFTRTMDRGILKKISRRYGRTAAFIPTCVLEIRGSEGHEREKKGVRHARKTRLARMAPPSSTNDGAHHLARL